MGIRSVINAMTGISFLINLYYKKQLFLDIFCNFFLPKRICVTILIIHITTLHRKLKKTIALRHLFLFTY